MNFDGIYRKSQEIRTQLDDCTTQLENLVRELRREVDRLADVSPTKYGEAVHDGCSGNTSRDAG